MDYALAVVGKNKPPSLLSVQKTRGWSSSMRVRLEEGKCVNCMVASEKTNENYKRFAAISESRAQFEEMDEVAGDMYVTEPFTPYRQRTTCSSITIAFEPSQPAQRYEVNYGVQYSFGWETGPTIGHNDAMLNSIDGIPTCRITGLKCSTHYVFMVRMMTAKGKWSEWSEASEAITTKKDNNNYEATHLFVLCHGFAANEKSMNFVANKIELAGEKNAICLRSTSNSHFFQTKEGIDVVSVSEPCDRRMKSD